MPKLPIPKAKPSRARKAGDDATNARKRYVRQAERYMRQSDSNMGIAADRFRYLAAQAVASALQTYEKLPALQRMQKSLRDLATRLDIPLEPALNRKERSKVIAQSVTALDRSKTKAEREEFIGRKLMSSFVGHRIYGATEHIWREKALRFDEQGKAYIDKEAQEQAILDYFQADNMFQVIQRFEEDIPDLYKAPKSTIQYDDIVVSGKESFRV